MKGHDAHQDAMSAAYSYEPKEDEMGTTSAFDLETRLRLGIRCIDVDNGTLDIAGAIAVMTEAADYIKASKEHISPASDPRLDEWEKLANAAPRGPWILNPHNWQTEQVPPDHPEYGVISIIADNLGGMVADVNPHSTERDSGNFARGKAIAAFIAASREAIPALIAMVRKRDADIADLEKFADGHLARASAAEAELAQLKARYAPGHTDMMVSPEALDEWMAQNPLPEDDFETMIQRGADALPHLWTDHDRLHYARRAIHAAMDVQPPAGKLCVHRDLGPGFTHNDSPDCPCVPHVIDPDDQRTADQILDAIRKKERGDA